MKKIVIFYSWQSDLRNNSIQNCIDKAIKDVKKKFDNDILLEINIDRDTRNRSGSPAISSTIFQKIDLSDIFICDITLVNKNWYNRFRNKRITPNPNVLIELGYAINQVGWERVICLSDLNFSSIEELPFDIRGHRITTFNSSRKDYKENLTITISMAISSIIKNFKQIIEEQNKKNNKYHDLNLYNNFTQICSEVILLDSLSLAVSSLYINKYYLEKWDSLQKFYRISENIFIDKYIDETVNNFLKELDNFDSLIVRDFHLDEENHLYKEYLSLSVSNIELTEEQIYSYKYSQVYKPTKSPVGEETWPDADKRILDLQDKLCIQEKIVKETYKEFVMAVKKNLL